MRRAGESVAILHIGAPKCGSSALQAALSARPDLCDAQGRRLRYVALQRIAGRFVALRGGVLCRAAALSPYGYVSMPDPGRQIDPETLCRAISDEIERGARRGYVPILSCEGWIRHPGLFAQQFETLGHPPIDVFAALRPPLSWMNAAYWQWGVWYQPSFDKWLNRRQLPYSFGDDLGHWAAIPNLRLQAADATRDVITQFEAFTATRLSVPPVLHGAASPAMIGFLMRNRRFRRGGHDAALEFVLQRWWPAGIGGGKPWAVAPHNLERLSALTRDNREALARILPEGRNAPLLTTPLWRDRIPFQPEIERGPVALHDRDALAAFSRGLDGAISTARERLGAGRNGLDPIAPSEAPLAELDLHVARQVERLVRLDRAARRTYGWRGLEAFGARLARAAAPLIVREDRENCAAAATAPAPDR